MTSKVFVLAAALSVTPGFLYGQFNFRLAGREVQVHSFASQGFAYTGNGNNNYLTMKTSKGSFAFTDGGVTVSTRLTDKLRIGAQMYVRNLGNLGQGEPQLDWAVGDYRFTNWLGIRGGVVKTVFGLHNDEQDMEFLHTNALLPQSIYPADQRDALIRHMGGDVYGDISLGSAGALSYTGFAGQRQDGLNGGYPYLLNSTAKIALKEYGGLQFGGDLRWRTPLNGLTVGASHLNQDITGTGIYNNAAYKEYSNKDQANQGYAQYTVGKLRLEAEYRRWWRDQQIMNGTASVTTDVRSWYALGAYRVSKYLELGAYYSRQMLYWGIGANSRAINQDDPSNHLYDKVVSARFDINSHWNFKVEGHFVDGWGGRLFPSGFYLADNPGGPKANTNVLIVRTGWNF